MKYLGEHIELNEFLCKMKMLNCRICSGCVRLPSMDVHRVNDINLDVSVFEQSPISTDIRFNINGEQISPDT